jgi:hypothetical protein
LAALLLIPVVYWIALLLSTYLGASMFGAMLQGDQKQYIGLVGMVLAAALACAATTGLAPSHRLVGFIAAAAFRLKRMCHGRSISLLNYQRFWLRHLVCSVRLDW